MSTQARTQPAILDIRSMLNQATTYLVVERRCSSQEAWDWIQHEARAKRAELRQVAQAVVQGEAIPYHYDVPI